MGDNTKFIVAKLYMRKLEPKKKKKKINVIMIAFFANEAGGQKINFFSLEI